MSGNQQRRLHWSFKLAGTAIAFLVLAIGALELLLYERNTWDVFVNFDGETVKVTTTHRRRRAFIQLGHDFLIEGGGDTFTTTLLFSTGRQTTFRTIRQPRAIWKLDGKLYVACCTGYWLLARLEDSGQLTPISKASLPKGPRSWNLDPYGDQSQKAQDEWESEFQLWCE